LNDIIVYNPGKRLADSVRVAVFERRVAIWTSPYLITETVAGSEADRVAARTKLAFLREVSGGHMLKYPWDLLKWEAIHGSSPSNDDRFLPHDEETEIYEGSLAACDRGGIVFDPEDGSERSFKELVDEQKRAGQSAALEATDAARKAVLRAFEASQESKDIHSVEAQSLTGPDGGVDFVALGRWMLSMPSGVFAGWVAVEMEQYGKKRTVTAENLPLLPYTGSAAGHKLPKIARNYETGQIWAKNDTYDAQYCVAASQADMFVTSDVDLRKICSFMPCRNFEVGDVGELKGILSLL